MSQPDFIVAPEWLIPVEPAGVVLTGHALAVTHGRISAIAPARDLRSAWPAAPWLARPGHALLPGLINAHTHAPMTLLRGYADDLPLQTWLEEHIWPAEGRWINREFVRDGADLAILEMIRGGTTCFQDMYFFPDEVALCAAERGLRASVSMIVLEIPSVWAHNANEYLDKGLQVHDRYKDHPLVTTVFGPHAPYTVGDAAFNRVVTLANQLDANVHMHVHETADEVAAAVAADGVRPLRRLDQLGLVNPLLNAVHATQLDDNEIALLAERGVSVIHCPESNMKLASGLCRVQQLLDAGVNVALGTDGAASNNDLDMWGEMRTAALLGKAVAHDASAISADAALRMATLNGARALGIGDETGSLEAGKAADMICVDLTAPATQPVHNPLSLLVYSTQRDQVKDVWVAGKALLRDGQPVDIDERDVLERATIWAKRMHDHARTAS